MEKILAAVDAMVPRLRARANEAEALRRLLHESIRDAKWTNWTNLRSMKRVNVHDAKTRHSVLLAEVERVGKRFVICRNGKPLADLIPRTVTKCRWRPIGSSAR